ncbi:hypothetical protein JSE7799_01610 [Jannaschia seosinensis]|uniref:Uncharacterized protein n=1 Tax=Jannaschia seosinensis TaxID=313367 RepID=A0A0M7B938_9RHOB|nr:hypothetical protein JSE7799_01610 [Jannaschia seosinensis]
MMGCYYPGAQIGQRPSCALAHDTRQVVAEIRHGSDLAFKCNNYREELRSVLSGLHNSDQDFACGL